MDDTHPIIMIRDLAKDFFDRHGKPVRVLKGVSLEVYRGEIVVVMGGSGCGKSTLLNCLIGELKPDDGSIVYQTSAMQEPRCIRDMDETEMNTLRKQFGIVFQSAALFNSMTVADNIALPLREHSHVDASVIDVIVKLKLEQVRMLPHANKMPAQLSGGQRKRAGLARATALDPEILFYDEPSAGLDPVTSAAIDELISHLARRLNVTSVVVTHDMDSAFHIADRMVMLDQGRVLKVGTKEDFQALRDMKPENLTNIDDQIINQFLNGFSSGPLTDADGVSEFEEWIMSHH